MNTGSAPLWLVARLLSERFLKLIFLIFPIHLVGASWVLTIWPLPLLSYFSWALPPPMELTLQLDTLSPVPTTCLFAKYLLLITSQPWVPSLINHTNSATLCQALLGLLRISEQWYCRSQDFRDGILIKSLLQPFVLFITELLFQFQLAHWYSNF